jgi:lysophospholipase L1-like esterase
MRTELRLFALASILSVAACGGSESTSSPNGNNADGGGNNGGGNDGGGTASASFKTHVILGDSISNMFGEGPYFYQLIDHNDDNKWPDYKGKDLTTKYGSDLKIVTASKGGATGNSLDTQVHALPATLDGPVLVTITIGGNDVVAAMGTLLLSGNDDADVANFKTYLDKAFGELTMPGRFGAGVDVKVLVANIYDPSDGTGTFKFANGTSCGQPFSLWNKGPTAMYLSPWEDAMAQTAAKYPAVTVLDMHSRFMGHGIPAMETWFYSDCIHPNSPGHNEVRGLFWDAIEKM